MITQNIHINSKKKKIINQITLEKDLVIPDKLSDIEKIITEKGNVVIENVRTYNKKADVNGNLSVAILYKPVCCVETEIPFSESVNIEDIEDGDNIRINYTIENLKVTVINSRKISIKSIVTFYIEPERIEDIEAIMGVENGENIEYISKTVKLLQFVSRKKDVFRIKDEVEISKNKPNIGDILWKSVDVRNNQARVLENKITVCGEINVFIIYRPDDENSPIQWIDSVVPYNGTIDAEGINESMIPDIITEMSDMNVEIRPDYDGEQRVFGIDAVLDIDARIYEENSFDLIEDVFCPGRNIKPVTREVYGECLVMKNNSQCRFGDKISMSDYDMPDNIMQICNVNGNVCIDSIEPVDNGININGVVETVVMYVSENDDEPFGSVRSTTPFEYRVETNCACVNCDYTYSINHSLNQLNYNMTGNGQIEIKGVIGFDVTVCRKISEDMLTDVEHLPVDSDMYKNIPGVVIYYAKCGDRLWDIAKKYNTTVKNIKEVNDLNDLSDICTSKEKHDDCIKEGTQLVIVKKMTGYL